MELNFRSVLEEEFDAVHIETRRDFEAWSSQKYPAKQHARKVAAELAKDGITDGIIYLPGQPTVNYEDSDQPPPLRQRRYFFYLTGANFHDCAATYEIAHDRLVLWIPYVEPRQLLWFGSTPSAAQAARLYDVDEARYSDQLAKFFASRLNPSTTLLVLHADQRHPAATRGKLDSAALQPAMDRARCVKDAYEIAMVRRANDVSSLAHRRVAQHLRAMANERDIEAVFRAVCTARGARDLAYPVIAGAGANAATLHYEDNDQPLAGKEVVVVDAGCEWNCYASDITRTLPMWTGGGGGGYGWSPRGARVHALVQQMQESCIEAVRPGVEFRSLHLLAVSIALEGLRAMGILRGGPADIAAAGTVAAFFPHGLGHHVGLEVHDVPGDVPLLLLPMREGLGLEGGKRQLVSPATLAALAAPTPGADAQSQKSTAAPRRRRQILQSNMIVTIEPGIYFCREYIEGYFLSDPKHAGFIDRDVLELYYPVGGVRIEDDILVTEDGYENLTTAPKGDELLALIREGVGSA